MKKILFGLLFFAFPAITHGVLMGFGDGKGLYNETGKQLYTCFADNTCIGLDDKIYTRTELGVGPVVAGETTYVPQTPDYSSPTPIILPTYTPPVTQITPTPSTPAVAGAFSPFSGNPYEHLRFINSGQQKIQIGINLTREEKLLDSHQSIYRFYCISPNYPTGSYHNTVSGQYNPSVRLSEPIALEVYGSGHYTCHFEFNLPEGTFESQSLEFDLVQP